MYNKNDKLTPIYNGFIHLCGIGLDHTKGAQYENMTHSFIIFRINHTVYQNNDLTKEYLIPI